MRDRDRWWWPLLLVGLAFGVGGVAVLYVGVRTIPTDDPYMTSADYWLQIGLIGLLTADLPWRWCDVYSHGDYAHSIAPWLAALHGDANAMPLADIHADPALRLMWRISPWT